MIEQQDNDYLNQEQFIEIEGARVHNLKNIDIKIPRDQLVVITGLSGSGKSSLAFDTIYAEGQRRYIESFASYARQFLGNLERPDVDKISGLSPVVSIEQKTVNKNPRSTVGTITEIYDFLRLLFARASDAFSYNTNEKMVRFSDEQIIDTILEKYNQHTILILAPVVKSRKGHYRELFEQIIKQGYIRARINGKVEELRAKMQLDRYKTHNIEVVIDKIFVDENSKKRLNDALRIAMKMGKDSIMVMHFESQKIRYFSRHLMCLSTGISYDEPAPNNFSFNSPMGSCSKCNGLGTISEIDTEKIIPNPSLSIKKGGITVLGEYKNNWIFNKIENIGRHHNFNLNTPIEEISEEAISIILYGTEEMVADSEGHLSNSNFEGIINFLIRQQEELNSKTIERWVDSFMNKVPCNKCNGTRLKKEALYFKIDGKNIAELSNYSLNDFFDFIDTVEERLEPKNRIIAHEVIKEIRNRTKFLLDVGLDYLTLNRSSQSLSGGEAQRIRLATQIGSQLVGVLYILDEPSIGLHQRDNTRLIDALKKLRDLGNSLLVVEHDKEMIENADFVIDIGPKAGVHGGNIVAACKPEHLNSLDTITSNYITQKTVIQIPKIRREGNGKFLSLIGAKGHNLKDVSIDFPLGKLICISGVSGSGKSSLINETLYPILNAAYFNGVKKPLEYKEIKGLNYLDKVIEINQSPIGRTPRSNPATYTNVFTDIRTLYSELAESKIRGYKPGRFSFNVNGGRCEDCLGAGIKTIEMNFLPDVHVHCSTCDGKRFNRETLEVRYHSKSISDVLNMTIDEACTFFENIPSILHKIKTIKEVGLGYITLGQQSTTLSGGEAQRIKLATELSKKATGNTFYILDEPSTGLHFEDIRILMDMVQKLVDQGNTVLIIEHNLDILKLADYIIDMGPEGGDRGGSIIAKGTPEIVAENPHSITAKYLKLELPEIVQTTVSKNIKSKKTSVKSKKEKV
jgi:excinuclease ABC subunit A